MSEAAPDHFGDLLQRLRDLRGPAAWDLLERAAAEHPGDPRPLVMLGAQLMAAGLVDPAESMYISALQRAPTFDLARFQLGLLQLTSARPAAAMATWAPLERLGSGDSLCCFKRGMELLALNQAEEARRWLLAGMAVNTNNEPLNRDIQGVIDRLEQGGIVAAVRTAPGHRESSVAVSPGDAPADGPAEPDAHFLVSSYRPRE